MRRATYTGTARLNGPDGDLAADKIEIYLLESGSEIDHLEAYIDVKLRTPDGRRAAGNRLTYTARNEQYYMAGDAGDARGRIGRNYRQFLAFLEKSTDRIVVDGKEQRRTELKRGIKR